MSSMEDENPRKRARLDPAAELDGTSNDDAKETKPDEEFWFEDGNLILVAGNVKFRVYQGPLIAHSPVIKDTLSLPQPAEEPPCYAHHEAPSCPIIPLTDSPHDLRHFLRVFLSNSSGKTVR